MAVGEGGMAFPVSQNHQIFGTFTALLENCWTFAIGNDESFEFYCKILNLAPLLNRHYDTSVLNPLLLLRMCQCDST